MTGAMARRELPRVATAAAGGATLLTLALLTCIGWLEKQMA